MRGRSAHRSRLLAMLLLVGLVPRLRDGAHHRALPAESPSEPDEVQMGIQAYKEVTSKATISSNSVYNAQVNRVAQRIIAAVEKPNLPWEVEGDRG